jgi:hypothetical protein
MTKAAGTEKELAALHKKLTKAMIKALESDNEVNPALLQAVSKFLKDNDITCPQDESEDLNSLATRLKNKRSVGNVTHIDED